MMKLGNENWIKKSCRIDIEKGMGKFVDNRVWENEQIMRYVKISSFTLDKTEKHYQILSASENFHTFLSFIAKWKLKNMGDFF